LRSLDEDHKKAASWVFHTNLIAMMGSITVTHPL
jgi:hypothetical protein